MYAIRFVMMPAFIQAATSIKSDRTLLPKVSIFNLALPKPSDPCRRCSRGKSAQPKSASSSWQTTPLIGAVCRKPNKAFGTVFWGIRSPPHQWQQAGEPEKTN